MTLQESLTTVVTPSPANAYSFHRIAPSAPGRDGLRYLERIPDAVAEYQGERGRVLYPPGGIVESERVGNLCGKRYKLLNQNWGPRSPAWQP